VPQPVPHPSQPTRYESVRSDFAIPPGDNNAFGRDRAESSQFGMTVPPPKIRNDDRWRRGGGDHQQEQIMNSRRVTQIPLPTRYEDDVDDRRPAGVDDFGRGTALGGVQAGIGEILDSYVGPDNRKEPNRSHLFMSARDKLTKY